MSVLAVLPFVGDVLDKIFPDAEKKQEAKLRLLELEQTGELKALAARSNIVMAEAQGESWLQRNWRPMTMVWFSILVGAYWFGFTPENLSANAIQDLFTLVQIGLGGYVVGRSAEKIAKTWKEDGQGNR